MTEPNLPSYLVLDGVQYVSTAEAVEHFAPDVTKDMIRDWVKRGLLKPVGKYGGRSSIFRLLDVANAERRTRLERRGRTRRAGELQKIDPVGQNLSAGDLAKAVHKQPRCTVLRNNGLACNRFAVPDAPFRICRDHMRQAYLHWKDHLPEVLGFSSPELAVRVAERPPREQATRQPFVYYIRFGDRIKIGHSVDVRGRLANLPYDELLALEPGPLDLERMRHHQFVAHRLTSKGEWFHPHPDLLSHIEMLVNHFGPPEQLLAGPS